MTKEELLKPRYKVIADYPMALFSVGTVFQPNLYGDGAAYLLEGESWLSKLSKYPHLFRKLEWWEEREEEDMPEYVKVIPSDIVDRCGLFGKVHKWKKKVFDTIGEQTLAVIENYLPAYETEEEFGSLNVDHLLPATKEEYEEYLKTLNASL